MGTTAQKLAYTATSVNDIQAAIIEKGVAVPSTVPLGDYGNKIREISTGIVPTGNIELQQQTGTDVTQYATASVKSGAVNVPTTTVTTTPTISVNTSTGLITASNSKSQSISPSVSTAGWINTGTAGTITISGSATSQLSTQAAKTITPTTSVQTAVAANKYTTGTVTVAAIQTETITITVNGTYTPSTGKYFSQVTVDEQANNYYTGSDKPAASFGENGDIYLQL